MNGPFLFLRIRMGQQRKFLQTPHKKISSSLSTNPCISPGYIQRTKIPDHQAARGHTPSLWLLFKCFLDTWINLTRIKYAQQGQKLAWSLRLLSPFSTALTEGTTISGFVNQAWVNLACSATGLKNK